MQARPREKYSYVRLEEHGVREQGKVAVPFLLYSAIDLNTTPWRLESLNVLKP